MVLGRVSLVRDFLFSSLERLIRLDFLFFSFFIIYTASSTGLLLKTIGLKVTAIKIDPYMNIDAGTIRPTEHGKTCYCLLKPIVQFFNKKKKTICFLEYDLGIKGKSTSSTMVGKSIWIWETMNVISM